MSLAKHCHQSWYLGMLLLVVLLGCREPKGTSGPLPMKVGGQQASDVWDVMYIGDAKVGYGHTATRVEGSGDDQSVETISDSELTFDRFGQTVTLQFQLRSLDRPDGTPLAFSTTQKVGPSASTAKGKWNGNQVAIEATTLGKTETKIIAWEPQYGSVFAKEQSLQRQPLKPGEERKMTVLFPLMNQLGELRLRAGEYETTKLLAGEAKLLKVDCSEIIGAERISSTLWVNDKGEILKQYMPQLRQTSYRTTQEIATGKSTGPKFDLGDSTIVKVAKAIPRPHQTQSITYKVTLPEGDISEVFALGATQQQKVIDEHTAELTVSAVRPNQPAKLAESEIIPTKDDLAANNLIQSDDPLIVKMANAVLPGEKDPWKVAVALEAYVRRYISKKDFSEAFASAAEVAHTKVGDCTEHAVLLAALCRARGIPARGAMGLVYYPEGGGFAYHMWTEVWIKDRWVPLDATLGQGGIGAAHLKLAQSNLKGADAMSAFLPVFRVLGQLQLEVIEIK